MIHDDSQPFKAVIGALSLKKKKNPIQLWGPVRITTIFRARQNLCTHFKSVSPNQVPCSYLHLQILSGDKWDTEQVNFASKFQKTSFLVFPTFSLPYNILNILLNFEELFHSEKHVKI